MVKTVFATLPELIDPPAETLPAHLSAEAKIIQQLRFIMVGGKHWQGLGKPATQPAPQECTLAGNAPKKS